MSQWRVVTDCGTVTVVAKSEAQAASRGKWKAVHAEYTFQGRAEEMAAVRDCEVYRVERVS